ncbi:alpha beta-hydrolase, partial [Setomelanomma holmii]
SSSTFTWKTDPEAGAIPAYVYFSPSPSEAPRPIALMFHAGGFVLGSSAMVPQSQISGLVERGFVVVVPEYRLCPQVSLYEGPMEDAKDVLTWCRDELPTLLAEKNVILDTAKIVAMGHSAGGQLALITGTQPHPPVAIVDFYGGKYYTDEQWSKPLPAFAQMPDLSQDFTAKVFDGPGTITSAPMFVASKPNLSDPRCAWYIQQIKNGTSMSSIVPDGDYARVDATFSFSPKFPPTYFLHGKPDIFVGYELSVRAHEALKKVGVETELVLPEDVGHAFDLQLSGEEGEELFGKYVMPALDWLKAHV